MNRQPQVIIQWKTKAEQYGADHNEYDAKRITNIIRRYYELRSAAEITAAHYSAFSGGSGSAQGKDYLICVLAGIDQGLTVLSARQRGIITLLQRGYLIKEIGEVFGLSPMTIKLHIRQAGFRLANYLNASSLKRAKG